MFYTTRNAMQRADPQRRRLSRRPASGPAGSIASAAAGAVSAMGALGALLVVVFARVSWAACTGSADSCLYNPGTCGACTPPAQVVNCAQPKTIHLTIDDGPFDNTPTALQILAWKQVKATFFVVGSQIAGREQILRDIYTAGHYIGSHSNTHPHLGATANLEPELTTPTTLIKNALQSVAPNYEVKCFRPPFGECPTKCSDAIKAKAMVQTYWSSDSQDWQFNMSLLTAAVDGLPTPTASTAGQIMLIHLENNFGLCALPTIIDRLRFKGYNWVSADQCWGTASTTAPPVTVAPPTTNPAWPACTTSSVPVTGPSTNPCTSNNGGCMSIATCSVSGTNTAVCTCPSPMTGNGISACTCPTGYYASGSKCLDVNECATNNGGCPASAVCANTAGSRTCTCRAGFTGTGLVCTNIDECTTTLNGGCFSLSSCTDVTPSAANSWTTRTCSACPDGYAGTAVGYSTGCVNVNECATANGGCSSLVSCTDLTPTPPEWTKARCGACPTGYTGDGVTCTDINECLATPKGGCSPLSGVQCFNTPGSFFCASPGSSGTCATFVSCRACPVGYNGNGVTCNDIDECATGTSTCLGNALCTNEIGGFGCHCRAGLRGDGISACANINECDEAHGVAAGACDPLTNCTDVTPALANQWNTRLCSACPAGYNGNGTAGCVDVNECALNHGGCSTAPRVTCTNTEGSRVCGDCPVGFSRAGDACVDVNECATANGGCFLSGGCTNTNSSRACSACPSTMSGNGIECVAKVQCNSASAINGGCDPLTACTAVTPSAANGWVAVSCGACPTGFSGSGATQCTDIDDCTPTRCANGGRCVDTGVSSWRCVCSEGFEGAACSDAIPSGPSAATVATVAVPSVLGGLLLIGFMVCAVRRHRASRQNADAPANPPSGGAAHAGAQAGVKPIASADVKPPSEAGLRGRIGSPRQPHILSVTNSPVASHL